MNAATIETLPRTAHSWPEVPAVTYVSGYSAGADPKHQATAIWKPSRSDDEPIAKNHNMKLMSRHKDFLKVKLKYICRV